MPSWHDLHAVKVLLINGAEMNLEVAIDCLNIFLGLMVARWYSRPYVVISFVALNGINRGLFRGNAHKQIIAYMAGFANGFFNLRCFECGHNNVATRELNVIAVTRVWMQTLIG